MASWYFITLTLLLLVMVGLLVYLQRRRMIRPGDLPRCGGCGYAVTGLPGPICPECGGDLTVVGIVRPGERVPPSRIASVVAWSLLLIVLTPFLIGGIPEVIDRIIPGPWRISWRIQLTNPCSSAYKEVRLSATDQAWDVADLSPHQRTVTLVDRSGVEHILDINDNGLVVGGELAGERLSASLFEDWFNRIGIAGESERLRREATIIAIAAADPSKDLNDAIWDEAHAVQAAQHTRSARRLVFTFGGGGVGKSGPSPVISESVIRQGMWVILALAWMSGIVFIIYRRRAVSAQQ